MEEVEDGCVEGKLAFSAASLVHSPIIPGLTQSRWKIDGGGERLLRVGGRVRFKGRNTFT